MTLRNKKGNNINAFIKFTQQQSGKTHILISCNVFAYVFASCMTYLLIDKKFI